MKVLFAVHDEKVSLSIVKKYQKEYKEIISYKNVYYFNAILKELQRDKNYDRIIIDEELEEFTSPNYEQKDKFIFDKLDNITDEASNTMGNDIPIVLICSDRRTKSEEFLVKLFGIGIYNAIIGNDRSTDEVCRLINKPRSKKDAKVYYKIDSDEVNYKPESEDDVSEEEMQYILSYFKKLGKDEERYIDAFKNIVSQYNEKQLRVIISILPLHVKSVLEENSLEYQRLVGIRGGLSQNRNTANRKIESKPSEILLTDKKANVGKPIVVPSKMDKTVIKKLTIKKPTVSPKPEEVNDEFDDILADLPVENVPEEPVKRGRGRPRKYPKVEEDVNKPKRGRGRPRKNPLLELNNEDDEEKTVLPGFEDIDFEEENKTRPILPKFDDIDDDEDSQETTLPGFDDIDEEDEEETVLPGFDDVDNDEEDDELDFKRSFNSTRRAIYKDEPEEDDEDEDEFIQDDIEEPDFDEEDEEDEEQEPVAQKIEPYNFKEHNLPEDNNEYFDYTEYNSLLSTTRKVITFVGTSKNGTSFIVNNIAKILSDSGIDTAILDATQNKNAYYIYTRNEEELRRQAIESIDNLVHGVAKGVKVRNNLTVYTGLPNRDNNIVHVGPILETLIKEHSAVLIDCDFDTPLEYFDMAQEVYLVQSMDVLTIQPLTAFLRELKNRNIIDENKLRIVLNKIVRIKGVSSKTIVGGMSFYNDPEMSFMTELFNRNMITPIEIPFDMNVYEKYLEELINCEISIDRYPKEFQTVLKNLASVIYPLLPAKTSRAKKGYQYDINTNSNTNNTFSNNISNTLDNMRKKY